MTFSAWVSGFCVAWPKTMCFWKTKFSHHFSSGGCENRKAFTVRENQSFTHCTSPHRIIHKFEAFETKSSQSSFGSVSALNLAMISRTHEYPDSKWRNTAEFVSHSSLATTKAAVRRNSWVVKTASLQKCQPAIIRSICGQVLITHRLCLRITMSVRTSRATAVLRCSGLFFTSNLLPEFYQAIARKEFR